MRLRLALRYMILVAAALLAVAGVATAVRAILYGQWLAFLQVAGTFLLAGWMAVNAIRSIRQLRS